MTDYFLSLRFRSVRFEYAFPSKSLSMGSSLISLGSEIDDHFLSWVPDQSETRIGTSILVLLDFNSVGLKDENARIYKLHASLHLMALSPRPKLTLGTGTNLKRRREQRCCCW
jgi:hypothetical protein